MFRSGKPLNSTSTLIKQRGHCPLFYLLTPLVF
jgi:hypothetical protein